MESPQSSDYMSRMQGLIEESSASIEAEFQRTGNSWPACFGTRVFCIECCLPHNTPDTSVEVARLEDLKWRLSELHLDYPSSNDEPPHEVKADFLARLNILGPTYPNLLTDQEKERILRKQQQ